MCSRNAPTPPRNSTWRRECCVRTRSRRSPVLEAGIGVRRCGRVHAAHRRRYVVHALRRAPAGVGARRRRRADEPLRSGAADADRRAGPRKHHGDAHCRERPERARRSRFGQSRRRRVHRDRHHRPLRSIRTRSTSTARTSPPATAVLETTIDADPVQTTVDLLAGNRPSGYTQVLAYACNGRCEANGPFPRDSQRGTFTDCTAGYGDFQNTAAYYVPACVRHRERRQRQPAHRRHRLQRDRRLHVRVQRSGTGFGRAHLGGGCGRWPPASRRWQELIADGYPVDYTGNAVLTRGVQQLAADLGELGAVRRRADGLRGHARRPDLQWITCNGRTPKRASVCSN